VESGLTDDEDEPFDGALTGTFTGVVTVSCIGFKGQYFLIKVRKVDLLTAVGIAICSDGLYHTTYYSF
jgi:hypothetical protein